MARQSKTLMNLYFGEDKGGSYPEISLIQYPYKTLTRKFFLNNNLKSNIFKSNFMSTINSKIYLDQIFSANISDNLPLSCFQHYTLFGHYKNKNQSNYSSKSIKYINLTMENKNKIVLKVMKEIHDPLAYMERKKGHINNVINIRKTHIQSSVKYLNPLIPKSFSNWKNPRGFTIPINYRAESNNLANIKKTFNYKFIGLSNIMEMTGKKT